MKKELMPPNTKKCGHEGNYSACLCGTYDALLEGVVDTPSLDKSEHDGTCRTPECYEKRPTPAVEELKHPKLNPICTDDCGNGILCPEKDKHFEKLRKSAEEISKQNAVEDWEEQLIKIAEPLYDADADNQTIKIFEEKIIRYVDSLLTSLLKSDRKRIIEEFKGMMKSNDKWSKRHQEQVLWTHIGYNQAIADAIKFITNLK